MNLKNFAIALVVLWVWLSLDFILTPTASKHACVNGEYYIKRGEIWIKEDQQCMMNTPIK